jgi:hypothetical protein
MPECRENLRGEPYIFVCRGISHDMNRTEHARL